MLQPDTACAEVSVETRGSTAVVTFQSPSLGRSFQQDLWHIMNGLESDPDITVIVFTGRKSVFMTGADLGEIAALNDRRSAIEFLELPHLIVAQFCESTKILIAAINGYCLGGGLELALACDIRVAVDQVRDGDGQSVPFLGFPEAQLGLIPALGGAYLAIEVLGQSQANQLFLGAERITSDRALQIGLVSAVVARENLLDEVLRLAAKIAANSRSSLLLIKPLLHASRKGSSLDLAMRETREAFADCCVSGDKNERIGRMRAERLGRFRDAVSARG
jgi:enoyl-CoA hydratase